jgi:hypothetical protein
MIDRSKYREYELQQTRIQGSINSEFDYFIGADADIEVIEDEFISNIALSGDYHDMMLTQDIQIAFRNAEIEPVKIPNYQTLEVMLVERGLTYDAIRVQTNIDDFIYNNLYSLDDRSDQYNNIIRFQSGYRPAFPFVRDPGNYIDGNDYDEQVYQKQTLTEKLRDQYEGKFITLRYDTGGDQGDYQFWNQLKIMIYGEWRSIGYYDSNDDSYWASWEILDYYNIVNGLNIELESTLPYVQNNSMVAQLIEAGGITNLRDNGNSSPVWNDFPHNEATDSPQRLDTNRYERYINVTDNDVFSLEYMQPYEPAGSELYYNEYGGWQQIQY